MARFRAYSSSSGSGSSDDDNEPAREEEQGATDEEKDDNDEDYDPKADSEDEYSEYDDDSASASSSLMVEDELFSSGRRKNALVLTEDGEYEFAHELDDNFVAPPSTKSIIPRAQQLGIDAQRMHAMQTSLFHMAEETVAMRATDAAETHRNLHIPSLNRKHSRDSDGDYYKVCNRERTSFDDNIELPIHRPFRKYARVQCEVSSTLGNEGDFVDAGLSQGRSFRVGWGPGGTLVHTGSLCGPSKKSGISANSATVYKTQVPITATSYQADIYQKLLQHHLSYSPVRFDELGIPFATPSVSDLDFASFSSLFPTTDPSYEASLFRLGEALFDPIDLHLGNSISADIRSNLIFFTRKEKLSAWLRQVVAVSVDLDLRSCSTEDSGATAFVRLTGNQVEQAVDAAIDEGNMKLATLVSQAGGDSEFRELLRMQLDLWREQKVDVLVDYGIKKVYAVLSGLFDKVLDGSKGTGVEKGAEIDVLKDLDWKRVFALHLWYPESEDTSVAEVFEKYRNLLHNAPPERKIARPAPWYKYGLVSSAKWSIPNAERVEDGLFALLRVHSDPACSLTQALNPLSFSPSPVDCSLPWHLYIILSRVMSIRDFADRRDPVPSESGASDDGTVAEGHSPTADILTSSYALQLERMGLIQEAMFVLLHIEGSRGREKALKDMILRSADRMNDWLIRGIVGSLKIPMSWVFEAQAIYAIQNNDMYSAYELYLQARQYNAAHDLAVVELAPDAVIRRDFELMKDLFSPFARNSVTDWHIRGKVFLDYADIMIKWVALAYPDSDAVPDATEAAHFETLTRNISRLLTIIPELFPASDDPRYKVATNIMMSALVKVVDKIHPLMLSQTPIPLINEVSKSHIRSLAVESFIRSITLE